MYQRTEDQGLFIKDLHYLYRRSETAVVENLLQQVNISPDQKQNIQKHASRLIQSIRRDSSKAGLVGQMMHQFPLGTSEGLLLMSLAESLLRIPDTSTREALLKDKLSQANFKKYFISSTPWLMKLSTRGFDFATTLLKEENQTTPFKKELTRLSLPVIRYVANQAMNLLAHKFIFAQTIEAALKISAKNQPQGYTHSFDMLGEAALTEADAERYFNDYLKAIEHLGQVNTAQNTTSESTFNLFVKRDNISIKLSALHPRYSYAQEDRVMTELSEKLLRLCQAAQEAQISVTIDAEESERLEISLNLIEQMLTHPALKEWEGLGLAVQAYQKRATQVIDNAIELAQSTQKRLSLRLVKGAYWDTEIKRCQELGLEGYPVFTRKEATDLSYLACAQKMLSRCDVIFPQFATHNALTVATIMAWAPDPTAYEFQKLHGMGDELYQALIQDPRSPRCRIYAPIGPERELLPYLVRRLLENGANTSFVNHVQNSSQDIGEMIMFPDDKLAQHSTIQHPKIPLPQDIFGKRRNSLGLDLSDPQEVQKITQAIDAFTSVKAYPSTGKTASNEEVYTILNPANKLEEVGFVQEATSTQAVQALGLASQAFESWNQTAASTRAKYLYAMADLMTVHQYELIALLVREAGKTIPDAIAEIREAVDFCRYYADRGEAEFENPLALKGITGEINELRLEGRGVFVCISPWNFPLAIFVGQAAAALMAGNCVIAKPARQTPLIAYRACQLFYEAGISKEVLHYLPGSGTALAAPLLKDDRVSGVAFTGSTDTAWSINRALAARPCAIAPLIAETGGQNALIADSSALPEQVISDVIASAFQSAGQRCSALRILFLQEEIAPRVIDLLKGAMAELKIGNPGLLSTDVGPIIDVAARQTLEDHVARMKAQATLIYECIVDPELLHQGNFIAPAAFELPSLDLLEHEVFGPILHIIRFKEKDLDALIDRINSLKFGLTFGLHTRLDSRIDHISKRLQSGNIYVNRNIIGAVVGVQPFGGRGLSGTGPKAGGPHYLHRFATEKTISINTTAQGGNTSLMML